MGAICKLRILQTANLVTVFVKSVSEVAQWPSHLYFQTEFCQWTGTTPHSSIILAIKWNLVFRATSPKAFLMAVIQHIINLSFNKLGA